jgi:hypothetical protein
MQGLSKPTDASTEKNLSNKYDPDLGTSVVRQRPWFWGIFKVVHITGQTDATSSVAKAGYCNNALNSP